MQWPSTRWVAPSRLDGLLQKYLRQAMMHVRADVLFIPLAASFDGSDADVLAAVSFICAPCKTTARVTRD
jgi:hypothetical protein